MLSPGGARGVQSAELSGDADSENNHGGSSRTYKDNCGATFKLFKLLTVSSAGGMPATEEMAITGRIVQLSVRFSF